MEAGPWASCSILPSQASAFFCTCPSKRLITLGASVEAREKGKRRGRRTGRRDQQ